MRWAMTSICAFGLAGHGFAAELPRGLCKIEDATYRLIDHEGDGALTFLADPKLARQSDLSAMLKLSGVRTPLKFTFAASNGYSTQYLVPVSAKPDGDAGGDGLAFYMFDAKLRPVELPSPGQTAPDYLFVPDLGKTLWYGSTDGARRIHLETGMWRRAECGR
jgi:hypothetical protein